MAARIPQKRSPALYGDDPGVRTSSSRGGPSSPESTEEIRKRFLENRTDSRGRFPSRGKSNGKEPEQTPLEKRREEAANISNNRGVFPVAKDGNWDTGARDSFKKDDFLIKQAQPKAAEQVLFAKRGDSFREPLFSFPGETGKSLMSESSSRFIRVYIHHMDTSACVSVPYST